MSAGHAISAAVEVVVRVQRYEKVDVCVVQMPTLVRVDLWPSLFIRVLAAGGVAQLAISVVGRLSRVGRG